MIGNGTLHTTVRDRYAMLAARGLNALDGRLPHRHEEFFEATQWWGPHAIRVWSDARLRSLLAHAYANVPFYRDRIDRAGGLKALSTTEDLSSLPVLTKDDMRTHSESLLTRSKRGMLRGMTSGTTGTPIKVWHDSGFISWIRALQRRAFLWHGVEPTQPSFYFGGPPHTFAGKAQQQLIDWSIVRLNGVCYDMSPRALDRMIDRVRKFRPRIVTGFPSALYGLALRAEETGTPLHDIGIRLIMPVSEVTPPHCRKVFERVFGAPMLTEYGCVEIGAMAFSCPAGRTHISHEHVIFEVLGDDGKPVPPGQVGRVVLTPLTLKSMPLIRYELGDLASLGTDACPCGRYPGQPHVNTLDGRLFDRMVDGNGRWWHAFILYYALKEVFDAKLFREIQGFQSTPGEVQLRIVPGPAFEPRAADILAGAVQEKVAGPLKVTWQTVNAIERDGGGKFKYFKSTLNDSRQSLS